MRHVDARGSSEAGSDLNRRDRRVARLVVLGILVGVIAGVLIGIPTFRLRGHYFALSMP